MPETQAKFSWTPPSGTLGHIVAEAEVRSAALALALASWREEALDAGDVPSLREALLGPSVAVIAEVKRQSPSKGDINLGIDAVAQAEAYVAGGASAISVLTEPMHFGGTADDLAAVAEVAGIPVIKKDFHVHPVQLYEARALGASAALLIARALSPDRLHELMGVAREIGLETVVEVRDANELDIALRGGATIIGVNNRNLETLVIDPETSGRVIPGVPQSVVAIAESGMQARDDIERAAAVGADAVLIGSAISQSANPEMAVRALVGVEARRDGRPR